MIVMRAKGVEFEVTYINLREKPDWFLKISPHGKVPVLAVDEKPLFESNAIAEFLDEEVEPPLHPRDAFKRARNRAWTDFVPDFAAGFRGIYFSKSKEGLEEAIEVARGRVEKLERAINEERGNDGPFFNGEALSLVDAAYAPFFQRLAFVEEKLKSGLLDDFPAVKAWSDALLSDERVTGSVAASFPEEFVAYLKRGETYPGQFFEAASDAAD